MRRGALIAAAAVLVAGCGSSESHSGADRGTPTKRPTGTPAARAPHAGPGVDVYAADRPGLLSPAVRGDPPRVYVPNSDSDTVDVIDQRSGRIVDHFATGGLPQHVTPSWDLKTLWVTNDQGNTLTPIDPRTGRHGEQVPVDDPYNLYFTPDGRYAIVVAERLRRLDFRDAHSMRPRHSLTVPCPGVDPWTSPPTGASCSPRASSVAA